MKVEVHSAEVVTVQVPFRFVKRGGRKEMVLPEGAAPRAASADGTLVRALARAFRWKRVSSRPSVIWQRMSRSHRPI